MAPFIYCYRGGGFYREYLLERLVKVKLIDFILSRYDKCKRKVLAFLGYKSEFT
jgi:hypothetical protein